MSIKKKIVWLPYDFDTAIGINNEGALVFDYSLEDTDHLEGGADVYNGQNSVIWNNIRKVFHNELASMYKSLRSTGVLSYETVEKMFEDHQSKWPEAIFNEDAWFKYILPLIEDGSGSYLSMLQGSKAEQRKWWLYNRFRYIDSKYNAGDSLSDVITVRGYAKADISVTPYADIYPSIKYGSYLVQKRGKRNTTQVLECPLDNVNDTEIYIYSASQLASVGDLSGLKVGLADFSMATKIQDLILGSGALGYENPNLGAKDANAIVVTNNPLLKKVDIRNCTALAQAVNLTGCPNIEEVYAEGSKVTSISLPDGGILKTFHIPNTVTNLTIRNQPKLTDFVFGDNTDYSKVTTCRIENTNKILGDQTIFTNLIDTLPENARLRLIGINIEWLSDTAAINAMYDKFDTFRGLDESGGNVDKAQVSGSIHVYSTTGSDIDELTSRYPYITIRADHVTTTLTLMSYDGEATIKTITCVDGVPQETVPNPPARSATAQYTYTALGWNTSTDAETADPSCIADVTTNRTVYAAYSKVVNTYTVYWQNNGSTIETDTNVPYGTIPHYDGSTPTKDGQTSTGWLPDPTQPITGNTTFVAQYLPVYTVTFKNDTGSTTLDTQRVVQGQTATYGGATPTSSEDASLAWLGWSTSANSHNANAVLTNVQSSMTVYAAFESAVEVAEITDSWDTIIANIDNGTYSNVYKVGNYKPLDLGTEGTINMQIVGMDIDENTSGATIPLTFVGMELLATTHVMNASQKTVDGETGYTAGGWENSDMRAYLKDTIKPLIPEAVRNRINKAKKYSSTYTGGALVKDGQITYDDVWIPGNREIFNVATYETQGPVYKSIFSDTTSRIKKRNGSASNWWLRSAYTANSFRCVSNDGDTNDNGANYGYGVALGFCLGREPESIEDSWSEIIAATADGSYKTKYSVGDTKAIDLGTEGVHLMEIVGIDADDKADGTGKAPLTFISKTLLNTTHVMNASQKTVDGETAYTAGGWENSDMRAYLKDTIKPLIPEEIRNAIVPVTKYSSTYTGGALVKDGQTTTDDVWIPGNREIFNVTTYETQGPVYSDKFKDATSRIKKRNGSAYGWWLRSAGGADGFRYVGTGGTTSGSGAYGRRGVALGFCIEKK